MNGLIAVLVVDDDRGTRSLLKEVLLPLGCRVRTASSARAARAELERTRFDLVVLDFRLPDATGDELIPVARRSGSAPAVIVVSGHAREEIGECLEEESVTFLAKPFSVEDFQAAFRTAILELR